MRNDLKIVDATLDGAFHDTQPYFDELPIETIQVSDKLLQDVDYSFVADLKPRIEKVGLIHPIGVRIRGTEVYDLIYGIESFLICQEFMQAAEEAAAQARDRRLYRVRDRWALIPARVFSIDTTDHQAALLRGATTARFVQAEEPVVNRDRRGREPPNHTDDTRPDAVFRNRFLKVIMCFLRTNPGATREAVFTQLATLNHNPDHKDNPKYLSKLHSPRYFGVSLIRRDAAGRYDLTEEGLRCFQLYIEKHGSTPCGKTDK